MLKPSLGSLSSQFSYVTVLPSLQTNTPSVLLSLRPMKTFLPPAKVRTTSFSSGLWIDTRFAWSFLQAAEASEKETLEGTNLKQALFHSFHPEWHWAALEHQKNPQTKKEKKEKERKKKVLWLHVSSAIDYNKSLLFSEVRRAGHKRNQSKKKMLVRSAELWEWGTRH